MMDETPDDPEESHEEEEELPEIEVAPCEDDLIECDDCIIGIAGGIGQLCAALDATAIRIKLKGGNIEALGIVSRAWSEIGRAVSAKVSAIPKEPKP